jgi:hypothetical protein
MVMCDLDINITDRRLVLGEIGWLAPLVALIGWAVVLHFHARFFGVPVLLPF